jgi:hypothetical protein
MADFRHAIQEYISREARPIEKFGHQQPGCSCGGDPHATRALAQPKIELLRTFLAGLEAESQPALY